MIAPETHAHSSSGSSGGGGSPQSSTSPAHSPQLANSAEPSQTCRPSWQVPMLRSATGPVQHAEVSPTLQAQPGCLNGAPESVHASGLLLSEVINTGLAASRPAVPLGDPAGCEGLVVAADGCAINAPFGEPVLATLPAPPTVDAVPPLGVDGCSPLQAANAAKPTSKTPD